MLRRSAAHYLRLHGRESQRHSANVGLKRKRPQRKHRSQERCVPGPQQASSYQAPRQFLLTRLVDQEIFRLFRAMHKEFVPGCAIRSSHRDTLHLTQDVLSGRLDAAIVLLPLNHPDLHVEALRQDKLVVCLRRDHPLAEKTAIHATELHDKLAVLYHPQRYPMLTRGFWNSSTRQASRSMIIHPLLTRSRSRCWSKKATVLR